ncbi:uncharacterized protein LOC133910667 [Phragmites australis]|uniref:uncharacterized protein LOC133910667 n=1 Tax=Phragmites australis TaxID=29695 RepID=UPI002D7848DB|nr:uncharacterized protein LOC133910667 [Phragmites australis]
MLESAREVIEWLEAAVAAERAELEKEHVALVDERGRLEEVCKLLETRMASARSAYEKSMREVALEREALEEADDEAVAAQEKAGRLERLAAERDRASRRRIGELDAREEQLARRERQRDRTNVLHREEQVALRETDVVLALSALAAREEQVTWHEADADLALSALAAQEERVANQEADLAAREQAIKAQAEQLEQSRSEVAARLEEVRAAKGVPTITTDSSSLEARLKNAEEELDTILQERTNVKLMMRDILRRARDSVEAAGLGRVSVGFQGLEMETTSHLALGFSEIARRLEALPAAIQELVTREGRALA